MYEDLKRLNEIINKEDNIQVTYALQDMYYCHRCKEEDATILISTKYAMIPLCKCCARELEKKLEMML